MRLTLLLLPCALTLACGGEPGTTATATETGGITTVDLMTTGTPATGTTANDETTAGTTAGPSGTTGTSEGSETTSGPTTTAPTSTGGDETTTTGGDETTTTGAIESCPCPDLDVALDDGIFVLAKNAALWKFFPATAEFELLGPLACDLPASTFSMGVDRAGFAWIQFSGGELRTVDVTDVSQCADPGYTPLQQGIKNYGMAFVSNSELDACDRIYGNHYNGMAEGDDVSDFFSVDPVTLQHAPLGKSDYGLAEVTGTGDGRAFLFANGTPDKLIEVDKATGDTLSVLELPGVTTGAGFAFAFFGGDFYFFTDAEEDSTSEVTHLDFDDSDNDGEQELTVVVQDAPLRIVGAGVSTCAPVIPQ